MQQEWPQDMFASSNFHSDTRSNKVSKRRKKKRKRKKPCGFLVFYSLHVRSHGERETRASSSKSISGWHGSEREGSGTWRPSWHRIREKMKGKKKRRKIQEDEREGRRKKEEEDTVGPSLLVELDDEVFSEGEPCNERVQRLDGDPQRHFVVSI